MFNSIARSAVPAYLAAKAGWSLANDAWMWRATRAALPVFAEPAAVWAYLAARYEYTGDPWGGAGDHYLSPYRLAAALAEGKEAARRLFADCDDVAGFAQVACRAIPGVTEPRLVTLYDDSGQMGHHVIHVGRFHGRAYAIDTNGHRWLSDPSPLTLCREWSAIYASRGFRYGAAFDSPYPW